MLGMNSLQTTLAQYLAQDSAMSTPRRLKAPSDLRVVVRRIGASENGQRLHK